MIRTYIALTVALVVLIIVVVAQVFLSRTKSRFPGLIMPVISFMFSLVASLGNVIYSGLDIAFVLTVLMVFIIYNIPTVIFLGIYFSCRAKLKKNSQLTKMNIQDLG